MSDASASLSSAFEKFLAFEKGAGLFSREVCGVKFWHYIRFPVYSLLVLPHFVPMGLPHPDVLSRDGKKGAGKSLLARLKGKAMAFMSASRAFLFRNPAFTARRREALFSLAPRIARDSNGRRLRQMIDYFAGGLSRSWAVLERPVSGQDCARHDGGGRIFEWREGRKAMRRFKGSREFAAMSPELARAVAALKGEIASALGVQVEDGTLERMVTNALLYEHVAVPLLKKWLRRLGVRCVVLAVYYDYTNLAVAKAAHDIGVPVVELQHGTIYPAHAAYNLPVADSPYSPDYLLGWGGYWLRQTRNFPARKALAVGYPFLERALADHPRAPHGGTPLVLFISQGTIGKDLSALAVELGKKAGNAYRIVFKPHPNEVKSWRRLYPDLVDSGVEVAEDATRGIYSWLAEADAVAGVYSTAMIEGLVWGVKAYVFSRLPGAETMAGFCSCGVAEYVDGTEALDARLRALFASGAAGGAAIDRADFFVDNAAANVSAAIDRIVEGKEP